MVRSARVAGGGGVGVGEPRARALVRDAQRRGGPAARGRADEGGGAVRLGQLEGDPARAAGRPARRAASRRRPVGARRRRADTRRRAVPRRRRRHRAPHPWLHGKGRSVRGGRRAATAPQARCPRRRRGAGGAVLCRGRRGGNCARPAARGPCRARPRRGRGANGALEAARSPVAERDHGQRARPRARARVGGVSDGADGRRGRQPRECAPGERASARSPRSLCRVWASGRSH